jgi:hypothetical protein
VAARKRRRVVVDWRGGAQDLERNDQQRPRRFDGKRSQALGSDYLQAGGGVETPADAGFGDQRVEHVSFAALTCPWV